MTDLVWTMNRLRTMSPAEVHHRLRRKVGQAIEERRVRAGWSPGEGQVLQQTRSLFADSPSECEEVVASWQQLFRPDTGSLDALLAGSLSMFGRTFEIGVDVDWHRDPRTGRRAPLGYGPTIDYRRPELVGDIKTLWELGRHQHLVPLAVAYATGADQRYRTTLVGHIDSWVAANPYGLGIHWCSALEVALRGISWCMVHSLLALRDGQGGLLDASASPRALARSVYHHGYFIRANLSRFSSANNHLIGELVGLLCLSSVFDFGRESWEWQRHALDELEREIEVQVWPDGVAREQAVQYQLELMDYFTLACCLAERAGRPFPPSAYHRIRRMQKFLRSIAPPGGALPQIGDSDEGRVNRFELTEGDLPETDILELVEHVFGASPERPPASQRAFWYRRIAPGLSNLEGDEVTREDLGLQHSGMITFPDGGYVVARHGSLHLVFDAGPLGFLAIAAHGHADALSLCAAWKDQWWLVDPGTYAYHDDAEYRAYFRGTSAHNTAMVGGRDQSLQGGAFMWLSHAQARIVETGRCGDGMWFEGAHSGYRSIGVEHARRVEIAGGERFRVIDRFDASSAEHAATLNFHFHPAIDVVLDGETCRATRIDSADDLMISLDPAWSWQTLRGSHDPIAGWYSEGLGRKEPCWTLRGTRPLRAATTCDNTFRFRSGRR